MARAYSDDLRKKYLEAHAAGKGTLQELAERFGVSLAWGWKISSQKKRTGQVERVRQQWRKSGIPEERLQALRAWLRERSDLTLKDLQQRWRQEYRNTISIGHLWRLLRKMDMRLKKSRSMQRNGTLQRTSKGGSNSGKKSSRSRRNS